MHLRSTARAIALLCVAAGSIGAQPVLAQVASAFVSIDNQTFSVPISHLTKLYRIDDGAGGPLVFSTAGGRVSLSGTGNPDPSIAYSLVAEDFGSPSTFSFGFGIPITLTGPMTAVRTAVGGQLTDMTGDGITLTALPPPPGTPQDGDGIPELQVATADGVSLGADVGPGISFGPGLPGSVYPFGTYTFFGGGPNGTFSTLFMDVNFMLSGGGDKASITGSVLFTSVPEPGSWALLASLGATGGCLLARKRRRGRLV